MIVVLSITIVVCTAALLAFLWKALGVVGAMKEASPPDENLATTHDLAMISQRFHAEIESLKFAIAEGIERTDRAEKRVQKTVAGARRQLSEAGIDNAPLAAEAAELRSRDEEGSDHRELPPVLEGVGATRRIRIPGGHLEVGAA